MRPRLWLTLCGGCLAAVAATWLAGHQVSGRPTEPGPILELIVGASLLGCGLATWRSQPDNRTGPIMVLTAFLWFSAQLLATRTPWLNTIGQALQSTWLTGLAWLLLVFPTGRLRGRPDRWLMASAGSGIGLQVLAMLFGNTSGLRCPGCESNVIQLVSDDRLALALLALQRLIGVVLISGLVWVLVGRWLRASPPERRAATPVVLSGCLTVLGVAVTAALDLAGDPLGALPANVYFALTATVPAAILYVFAQRRLARGKVARLVVELDAPSSAADLRLALSRALGDPSLELAYWFAADGGYVSGDGSRVRLPGDDEARRATFVQRSDQPIAVLIHDPALEQNIQLVRSVCAAASLALENERLQAELRARLAELQASRARLVAATDEERRRIERDLHDGTQQRLVSVAMVLGLLEARLPGASKETRPLVAEARETLATALQELRDLTHGISPPLLIERGLGSALEELCRRAALPVRLDASLSRRLPEKVETAAYFFASEALTNAAKHSHGREVHVHAADDGQLLRIEIGDDGIGGASPAGGSGLVGLSDRIEALGGRLFISSPPGRGTELRAEIPCA